MKVLLLILTLALSSCGKLDSETAAGTAGSLSSEAQLMSTISKNIETTGTSALSGVSEIPDAVTAFIPTYDGQFNKAVGTFDYETDCKVSGGIDETKFAASSALYPLYNVYCGLLKRPDGPDTVKGAIDRISGWLCAMGDITYDGIAKTKTITVSTDCFSQAFVTTVFNYLGKYTITATLTGYDTIGSFAPADFEKRITFVATDIVNYTIAIKDTVDDKAIAILGENGNMDEVFAVYMNKTAGTMKVEGRFPSDSRPFI